MYMCQYVQYVCVYVDLVCVSVGCGGGGGGNGRLLCGQGGGERGDRDYYVEIKINNNMKFVY